MGLAKPVVLACGCNTHIRSQSIFTRTHAHYRAPTQARYVERDLTELAEACARAPPDLPAASLNAAAPGTAAAAAAAALVADASNMFVEAQLAKRQRALGRAHVDDPMEVRDAAVVAS